MASFIQSCEQEMWVFFLAVKGKKILEGSFKTSTDR